VSGVFCVGILGESMLKLNGIRLKVKLMNLLVTLSVCKKLSENFLIAIMLNFFCPGRIDNFEFIPSLGASGGSIIVWNGSKFSGSLAFQNEFSQYFELTCLLTGEQWFLTNIYAPCTAEGKLALLSWFRDVEIQDDSKWLIVGDFNLLISQENRNKPGGNISEMLAFNEAISRVGLVEIPLKGCKYTWTNKQQDPLLERLDWFFYSNAWITSLPNTWAYGLSRDTSDQTPCLISAATNVPKSNVFRFENFWLEHHQFRDVFQHGWSLPVPQSDKAKKISAKFKNLRRVFKAWQS
jgi:hypothetical protein